MFETLFTCPATLQRHRTGPLAAERAAYLQRLAARSAAQGTLQRRARYCLCVAQALESWPRRYCFRAEEVDTLAASWAAERVVSGRASTPRGPHENFRLVAMEFLGTMERLLSEPPPPPERYEDYLEDFIITQRQYSWLSEQTCDNGRWQIRTFLRYLQTQGLDLTTLQARHIDGYFQHMAQRWSRVSLATAAKRLRAWFRHGEARGWVKPGLADAVLAPRIYQQEGLPLGPTWEQVSQLLANAHGDTPIERRDYAIMLLLAVYGLRSGEVRRLQLEDIDWQQNHLHVVRSKSARADLLPLEPRVGGAIAHYLQAGRPQSTSRTLFLTVQAPFRPLSAGGLYYIVRQ